MTDAPTTRQPPLIFATRQALASWRRLQERGIGHGTLENRCAELIPVAGTTRHRVVADNAGGRIFGDGWLATFAKGRRPSGRRTWTVVAVEERR